MRRSKPGQPAVGGAPPTARRVPRAATGVRRTALRRQKPLRSLRRAGALGAMRACSHAAWGSHGWRARARRVLPRGVTAVAAQAGACAACVRAAGVPVRACINGRRGAGRKRRAHGQRRVRAARPGSASARVRCVSGGEGRGSGRGGSTRCRERRCSAHEARGTCCTGGEVQGRCSAGSGAVRRRPSSRASCSQGWLGAGVALLCGGACAHPCRAAAQAQRVAHPAGQQAAHRASTAG